MRLKLGSFKKVHSCIESTLSKDGDIVVEVCRASLHKSGVLWCSGSVVVWRPKHLVVYFCWLSSNWRNIQVPNARIRRIQQYCVWCNEFWNQTAGFNQSNDGIADILICIIVIRNNDWFNWHFIVSLFPDNKHHDHV